MKVKTDYDGCSYIVAGKNYDVIGGLGQWVSIIDEDGDKIIIMLSVECSHLDGIGRWEVVE